MTSEYIRDWDIRNMITDHMKNNGLNQKEMAERIGVSEQYLSDVRNGKRDVTNRIADFFGYFRKIVFFKIRNAEKDQAK